jgi:hypothetical protein
MTRLPTGGHQKADRASLLKTTNGLQAHFFFRAAFASVAQPPAALV